MLEIHVVLFDVVEQKKMRESISRLKWNTIIPSFFRDFLQSSTS